MWVCPLCQELFRPDQQDEHLEECTDTSPGGDVVSDPDAMLEALVVKSSVPNLAALIRKGKTAGLIKPAHDYGGAN